MSFRRGNSASSSRPRGPVVAASSSSAAPRGAVVAASSSRGERFVDLDLVNKSPLLENTPIMPPVMVQTARDWFTKFAKNLGFYTVVARCDPSAAKCGDAKYAHTFSGDAQVELLRCSPTCDGNDTTEVITPQEYVAWKSMNSKGQENFAQRDRRGEMALTHGKVTMSLQLRLPPWSKAPRTKDVVVVELDASKPRDYFTLLNDNGTLADENVWRKCSGPHVVPKVGDLVCGIVQKTSYGTTLSRWFVCTEQFRRLCNLVVFGKYELIDASNNGDFTGYCKGTEEELGIVRSLMSGSTLCTSGVTRHLARLASHGKFYDHDPPIEGDLARVFARLENDYARTRTEIDACRFPHLYPFLFMLICLQMLPDSRNGVRNVPRNLGAEYMDDVYPTLHWILPQIIPEGGQEQSVSVNNDVAWEGDMCPQSADWVQQVIYKFFRVQEPILNATVRVPWLIGAVKRSSSAPVTSSTLVAEVPLQASTAEVPQVPSTAASTFKTGFVFNPIDFPALPVKC